MKTKNLLMIGLIALMSITISCKEDEAEANIGSEADLIGTWAFESASVEALINGQDFIQYFIDNLGLTEAEAEQLRSFFDFEAEIDDTMMITFKADGTYDAGAEDTGTFKFDATAKTILLDGGTVDEFTMDVLTLTSSAVSLSYSYTEQMDFDDDGTNEDFKVTTILNLKK